MSEFGNTDLLQFISDFVTQRYSEAGRRTNGAQLANAIRERFPLMSWGQWGYTKLADAVREAEERGLVARNRAVQHLEVQPPGLSEAALPTTVAPTQDQAFIRPEVWRAIVFVSSRQITFLERATGRLLALPSEDTLGVQKLMADPRYLRFDPIPSDQQRLWAKQFLAQHAELDATGAQLDSPSWWRSLSNWFQSQAPDVLRSWNQFRSTRVLDFLKSWCRVNGVSLHCLLSPVAVHAVPSSPQARHTSTAIRRAILAALAELPLEQLESIPIPARLLLRHLAD